MTRDEAFRRAIAAAEGNEQILTWLRLQYATSAGQSPKFWLEYFLTEWSLSPKEDFIEDLDIASTLNPYKGMTENEEK